MIQPKFPACAMAMLVAAACPLWAQDFASGLPDAPRIRLAAAAPDPLSKDALFGTDAASDEKPAAKFSGSFDALGAYTYSDPAHWSRGVGRLTLAAQGEFADNVKWKVGGRLDGDLVYATSNFYLDPVKRNQRTSAIWGENYVDFSAGALDFRLGAQQIVWGEVIGLFIADVVSARDMREFLLPAFDFIRIPQWAARAEYFAGDSHVEFVWIPVPTFDRIGKPGADFYPVPLSSPTPADVAAPFLDPQRPDRNLGNSNYGVRANTLVSGWDLAAFYYRSYSTQPTFYRTPTGTPGQPFVFQPAYDRIWQVGATATKDLGEMVLRGEAVYANGQGYSVTSLDVSAGRGAAFDAGLHPERRHPAAGRYPPQPPGTPAHLFRRRRGRHRRQERWIRGERIPVDQALPVIGAADPVDAGLQGRGRPHPSAP